LKRQVFNSSKYTLGGKWKFEWEIKNSKNYPGPISEEVQVFHYENTIKFLHTVKSSERYLVKGQLLNRNFTGTFNEPNKVGYDGAFQMRLNGQLNRFDGLFIGWQTTGGIGSGPCSLEKLKDD
jgi:hypothetical protein